MSAGGLVHVWEKKALDAVLRGVSMGTLPASWEAALYTTAGTDDGAGWVEASGGTYAAVALTFAAAADNGASPGAYVLSAGDLFFAKPTVQPVALVIRDGSSHALIASVPLSISGFSTLQQLYFPAGSISITISGLMHAIAKTLLNAIFRGVAPTLPTGWELALYNPLPAENNTGGTEITTNGCAPVAMTFNAATDNGASPGSQSTIASDAFWPAESGGTYSPTGWVVRDSAHTPLAAITATFAASTAGQRFRLVSGAASVTLD